MAIIKIRGIEMEGSVATRLTDSAWDGRESKAVTVQLSYAQAVALFTDHEPWAVAVDITSEDGTAHAITQDMSEYAISGPITDNRNGTVTIRMGKYRESELMQEALAAAPESHAQAVTWRGIIEKAVQSIPDDMEALAAAPLYPSWYKLVLAGAEAGEGFRFRYDGALYKVIKPHKFAGEWIPGNGTESLYTRIDETHAGTAEDPIPYAGNMALTSGLCYSQAGVVYRCTRDTGNPVHNALADLVSLYVEVVD